MIVSSVLNLLISMIEVVFGWINLPQLPDSIMNVVDEIVGYMLGSLGLLSVFVDMNMLRILLPLCIVVVRFEDVWKLTMFILRKIPFLNIN